MSKRLDVKSESGLNVGQRFLARVTLTNDNSIYPEHAGNIAVRVFLYYESYVIHINR
jgi:hypothetical protein